jgi:hypothetical protein
MCFPGFKVCFQIHNLYVYIQVMQSGGPSSSGTRADHVKFHDDKSQYTVGRCRLNQVDT